MGYKLEELEATACIESYNLITVIEMWWDKSQNQSVAINGYKLLRRPRQGWRGGRDVALYVKKID